MDTTAMRMFASRSPVIRPASATVSRSRVEPAPRDAAKPRSRDRRTGTHLRLLNLRRGGVFPSGAAAVPARIEWGEMRLPRAVRQYGFVALAIPGLLLLTGISTLADASPSPSAGASG